MVTHDDAPRRCTTNVPGALLLAWLGSPGGGAEARNTKVSAAAAAAMVRETDAAMTMALERAKRVVLVRRAAEVRPVSISSTSMGVDLSLPSTVDMIMLEGRETERVREIDSAPGHDAERRSYEKVTAVFCCGSDSQGRGSTEVSLQNMASEKRGFETVTSGSARVYRSEGGDAASAAALRPRVSSSPGGAATGQSVPYPGPSGTLYLRH